MHLFISFSVQRGSTALATQSIAGVSILSRSSARSGFCCWAPILYQAFPNTAGRVQPCINHHYHCLYYYHYSTTS